MKHISFDPNALVGAERDWWSKWVEKAKTARSQILKEAKAGKILHYDNEVWSELKSWLLDKVFNGKCAYCESKFSGVSSFGAADHYRPKGKVTIRVADKQETVIYRGRPHPGYYWLAYDWRNILPACPPCNSAKGKGSQFPIAGRYVFDPGKGQDPDALDRIEKPLLLHPCRDDPGEYIRFGIKGAVAAIDGNARGDQSILVYNLSRDRLRQKRQRAQEDARRAFLFAVESGTLKKMLEPYEQGVEEYSVAALDFLRNHVFENIALALRPTEKET